MNKRHITVGTVFIAVGIVTIVLFVILCAKILSAGPGDQSTPHIPKPNASSVKICHTPTCKVWADVVRVSMDTSVDPCDNFYKFACGNFAKVTEIPRYAEEVDMFSITRYVVEEQLKASLEEPIEEDELEVFKKVKIFYKDCMDTDKIEKMGLVTAKKQFKEIGGWPVLEGDNWNADLFRWPNMTYRTFKRGINTNALINIYISSDMKNNTKRIIYVQGGSFYSGTVGKKATSVQGYFNFLIDLAVAYGADPGRAKREAEDALDFEILLDKHDLNKRTRPNITVLYNKFTIAMLQRQYPSIPWLEYINNHLPEGISVNSQETVIMTDPKYFKYLEHLLNYTKKRIIANYIAWHTAMITANFLTSELRDIRLKYMYILKGVTQEPERWQNCAYYVKNFMPNLASAMYVRKYFTPKSKNEVLDIMKYVKDEFGKILWENDWMDEDTKRVALDKFKAIKFHIAYPEELLDDDVLSKTYGKLEIIPGDFFNSYLNIIRFNTNFKNALLRDPVNKTDWITHGSAITVNAFYKMTENALIFPAAVLQGQFFDLDRPRYMNFGSFGTIVGHEITHSFDDLGRQFDADGNFKDLWTPSTKKAFTDKVECFINQYDSYTVREVNMRIDGVRTQGENIADNGGALEAYSAYQSWLEDNSPEPLLPGLNYTQNQMFWISLALNWCQTSRVPKIKQHVAVDVHAPYEYRVIGALSNAKEFSRDFGCPSNAPMNRWYKCKLW